MSRYLKLMALTIAFLAMVLTVNFVSVPVSFAKPPTKTPTPTPTKTRTPTPTSTAYGPPPGPTATPGGQPPDLIVQSMYLAGNQNCFGSGFQLGIQVYLKNIGTGNAGTFVVDVNGAQQTVSGGLAAGQTTSLWFNGHNYAAPNNAYVDVTNLVVESNESNNSMTTIFAEPTPPPNCTPTPTP